MRAHPKTTYVKASPEVWGRVRAAYLSGLSAPAAAARFAVSVTALRKRARREGWTKAAQAANAAMTPPQPDEAAPDEGALHAAALASLRPRDYDPEVLARRALASAVVALNEGEGLKAQRLARAADEIAGLADRLSYLRPGPVTDEEERESDARVTVMRRFIAATALRLARDLQAGEPLSDYWRAVLAEVEAEDALA